jgi:hypothetical protein
VEARFAKHDLQLPDASPSTLIAHIFHALASGSGLLRLAEASWLAVLSSLVIVLGLLVAYARGEPFAQLLPMPHSQTDLMVRLVAHELYSKHGKDVTGDADTMRRLLRACELAVGTLSWTAQPSVSV